MLGLENIFGSVFSMISGLFGGIADLIANLFGALLGG